MDQHVLLESHNTCTSRESKQNLMFWGIEITLNIRWFIVLLYLNLVHFVSPLHFIQMARIF